MERLSSIRHPWVVSSIVKKTNGEGHWFILSVRRIFENRERLLGKYPVVIATLSFLRAIVTQSASQSSKLTMSTAFREFDVNGDKQVSVDEFKSGLESLGFRISPNDFDLLVKVLDSDGNGCIDYEEFSRYAGI